jgi:hypothetical protein
MPPNAPCAQEHLGEHRLACHRQADDLAAAVAAVRHALDPAAIDQTIDHASQRALGDERLFAEFGGGHAGGIA